MGVPCLLSRYPEPWTTIGSGSVLKRCMDCRFAVLLDWDSKNLPMLALLSDKAFDRAINAKKVKDTDIFAKDFEIITVKEKEYGSWIVLFIGNYTIGEASFCEST